MRIGLEMRLAQLAHRLRVGARSDDRGVTDARRDEVDPCTDLTSASSIAPILFHKLCLAKALQHRLLHLALDALDAVVERQSLKPGAKHAPQMRAPGARPRKPQLDVRIERAHGAPVLRVARLVRRQISRQLRVMKRPHRETQRLAAASQRRRDLVDQPAAREIERLDARAWTIEMVPEHQGLARTDRRWHFRRTSERLIESQQHVVLHADRPARNGRGITHRRHDNRLGIEQRRRRQQRRRRDMPRRSPRCRA